MSLQTDCVQFRAVGTLAIPGFVSEDMLGLEVSCRVAFAITKKKKPHAIGRAHRYAQKRFFYAQLSQVLQI